MKPPASTGLRVAIIVEMASLRFGGEASLPLHYFSRLRRRGVDAWLMVHARTRQELHELFPLEQDRILITPDHWLHRLLWSPRRLMPRRVFDGTVGILMQLLSQMQQQRLVHKLIAAKQVTLVYKPTPVSPTVPSLLANLGVPVVMGPMNGGMHYPPAFQSQELLSTRLFVAAGRAAVDLVNRLIPGKRKASVLLVANERTRQALPSCVQGQVIQLSENGVDLGIWTVQDPSSVRPGSRAQFLFMGRLVDWKRLDIALRALAQMPGATLKVIGDGDMRAKWATLTAQLNLTERVEFLGWLPQQDCVAHLHASIALLLPSIYECGGAVVLEAMATGTPVIATAWGGPLDYLDASCGILIQPTSVEAMIAGFQSGMEQLVADPELCLRLGRAGRARVVEHYDWERKIDTMLEVFSGQLGLVPDPK